jgi:hypothetical protein
MLRKFRRFFYVPVAMIVLVVAAVGVSQMVQAQGNNQFPGVNTGSEWNFDNRSPDPRLTWLYKGSGPNEVINGTTTHILRNRSLGRNIGTTLRVYYAHRPQYVRISINVVDCQLDAPNPFDGRVYVDIGGNRVYNERTRAPLKADHWYEVREYVSQPTPKPWDRVTRPGGYFVDSSERFSQSPVCADYGGYTVPIWADKEGCNDPAPGGKCNGVGNNTFTLDKTSGSKNIGGTNTKLDGSTFTVGFPGDDNNYGVIGYDAGIGLYYADVDITLTADDDTDVDPDVMQRISFRVNANDVPRADNGNNMNAKMGYRFSTPEEDASKYFGLQGNGGGNNEYGGYGQKFAIPFGVACTQNTQFDRRVVIYDPDVTGYGPSYAAVFKRGPADPNDPNSPIVITRLTKGEYNLAAGSNINWDNSTNDRIELTAGNNSNSVFLIREMSKGYQYMLVIVNPSATSFPPSTNVWSVKLPSDSINGLINCRYNLEPHLNGVKSTFTAYGDTVNPHGWITNGEDDTFATGNHEWRITKAVFPARPADLNRSSVLNSNDNEPPCAFIQRLSGAPSSCVTAFSATYPADSDETLNEGVGPVPIGTYVCYITSVRDPSWIPGDDAKWANSPMQCSVAGVKPKVQAWGYDTKATGRIKTSLSEFSGRWYGSWGEYSVLSNNTNRNMASGNGLLGGVAAGTPQTFWSPLTFANDAATVGFCGFGCYGGVTMPNVSVQDAVTAPGGGDYTVSSYAQLQTLLGGSKGKLRVNGTLFITGDLIYPDSTTGIAGIPKIELIANDIVIADEPGANVTQIDPWLIAVGTTGSNGRVSTCSGARQGANYFVAMSSANLYGGPSGICTNPLKFNSPIIADKVYLYRTYDEQNGARAAETLNVRADNFLSSYVGGGTTQPVATTDAVIELPPRF